MEHLTVPRPRAQGTSSGLWTYHGRQPTFDNQRVSGCDRRFDNANSRVKANLGSGARSEPGIAKTIIVRHLGGTVVEGRLKMSTRLSAFRSAEQFVANEEVICFLIYVESEHIFEFGGGPSGAFRVRQNQLRPYDRGGRRPLRNLRPEERGNVSGGR